MVGPSRPRKPVLSEAQAEGPYTSIETRFVKAFLDLVVLNQLRQGAMHGYDLMSVIEDKYGVAVGSSTLYPLLRRLEQRDAISGEWKREGRTRKTYTIKVEGLRHLAQARRVLCNLTGSRVEPPLTTFTGGRLKLLLGSIV